ncbi:uncharacterized protein PODANS_5_2000 [Podospora anserina S mat+]|uniref:Serine protease n=1 Tax=Podospora anserina (strain S / ATCC MYA-4624 / DSM 980 / FGSC 10383) TaxID=515849 RepID=B2AEN5_PODAN|nr:uncharacterized protein PODANS_5_2000 [Podospora anserina S mat+]CAP61901.1 unnamed protein product [Podospora anserina S mat+]CDP28976.1 Putative protein of unknown function [Podospora anserina S mat+]
MRYEGQQPGDKSYAMGTGWLIAPDLLVTAGHNVFDWSGYGRGLGKAVDIKAYIGYHGRSNINSPIVQFRSGKVVVTNAQWVVDRNNRHADVAFVKLDKPFTGNLRLFTYKNTPESGDDMIGVVGYPADKTLEDADGREEKGALMWEQFTSITYVLDSAKNKGRGMLKYRISTFGGQSGAPVIRKGSKQAVIGTHVYGGGDKNSASVIGPLGNDYEGMLKVFDGNLPPWGEHQGIKLVKYGYSITSSGASPTTQPAPRTGYTSAPAPGPLDAEGFFDDLKKVAKFVQGNVGPAAPVYLQPFLGGVHGAIAHAILGVINQATESALTDVSAVLQGTLERGILAEAALQSILKLEDNPITRKILQEMSSIWSTHYRSINFDPIICRLGPALPLTANKILSSTEYTQTTATGEVKLKTVPFAATSNGPATNGQQAELFGLFPGITIGIELGKFLVDTIKNRAESYRAEGWFDDLGKVIVRAVEREPLYQLTKKIVEHVSESSFSTQSLSQADREAAILVAKRAVFGETALQALSKLSSSELQQITMSVPEGQGHEESFGDFLGGLVRDIGGVVSQVAPVVVGTVLPFPLRVAGAAESGGMLGVPAQPLRKKSSSSVLDLIHGDGLSNGLLQVSNNDSLYLSSFPPPARGTTIPGGSRLMEDDSKVGNLASPELHMAELHQSDPDGKGARLEYLRKKYLADGPDENEDKLVFEEL